MSGRYLTDLADVCRRSGLVVHEQSGWQERARSSGGYADGLPDHVIVHHTASSAASDGWPDCDYCSYNSDIAPVANLYLSRAGEVYVLAAGCTNTNGSGSDPCGIVPDDSMNTHAIGVEAANDGVGEPWPEAQQDAYVILVSTLGAAYGITAEHCEAHSEWAPSRKIDPAGPSRWAPSPEGGTWSMDDFRAELVPASPTPGDDDMAAPLGYYRDDRPDGWQIWLVGVDGHGQSYTCPISDLPDGGKWDVMQPIVGDPPLLPFGALVGLMDRQNRPAP